METKLLSLLANELQIRLEQVEKTVLLLDEGATVPFLARYRKEQTGHLDEVVITQIRDRILQLRELEKRKEAILKSIDEQGKLSDSLKEQIAAAPTMAILEDLYLPYKPKRKTRASIAREKGLEPLAQALLAHLDPDSDDKNIDWKALAESLIDAEKGILSTEDALAGARDIIAETVNENAQARASLRNLYENKATVKTRLIEGKEEEGKKYSDYFNWQEDLKHAPSHRILALRRAEKEGVLLLDIEPDEEAAIELLVHKFIPVQTESEKKTQLQMAVKDAYKRLMKPSMETEIRLESKKRADTEAITVFADNVRELLLAAPFGEKRVLAIDPGFRTGCKTVALDAQCKLLEESVIYPNEPQKQIEKAAQMLKKWVEKYQIEAIAIGNGTASRETEQFCRSVGLPAQVQIVVVSENGASVYSASEVAREEFPDQDVTVRGAVSIGRRLIDPLAELVKIDPKSIGVGQYQHDVDQKMLKTALDDTVMSCVNAVGVEVNTASKELLSYVSGLGSALAGNIVKYRNENGAFRSRKELLKVPRLGAKAFEQAAGFLRIRNAKNPLDSSAVHPESYGIVEKMAADLNCSVADLMEKKDLRHKIQVQKYVTETVGMPTLQDILKELEKPGRDPRQEFEAFHFDDHIKTFDDVRVGMKLKGIVNNITDFGAFVDIGIKEGGLIHVSQMSDVFIKHPKDILKLQQKVEVTVIGIDANRKRISLSLRQDPTAPPKRNPEKNKTEKHLDKYAQGESQVEGQDWRMQLKNKFKK
ncbi:Tex family protein [Hugenholtzia roseola]|uniref:Tex family protein n=1 Tax=Hugenholtzia roseola TaxID=1002 RepID=UPI003CCBE400